MIQAFPLRSLLAASMFAAVAVGGLLLPAPSASAQSIGELKKNDDVFIDWLREKGAADALTYYGKAHPPKEKKAQISLQIAAASAKIDHVRDGASKLGGPELEKAFVEMRQATEAMLDAERQRCDEFKTDEMSLLWHARLLSDLLDNYLRIYRNDAAAAYEYGQPTPDQVQAFAEIVPEAFLRANQGDAAIDRFDRMMSSSSTYGRNLERQGLRIPMEEAKNDIRRWYGLTAYLMTLLPDTHPYYTALASGGTRGVTNQARDIPAERKRLLALALRLTKRDSLDDMTVAARNLAGRILAAQGQAAEAAKYYQNLDTREVDGAIAVQALCGQANALAAGGKLTEAVKMLRERSGTLQFRQFDPVSQAFVPTDMRAQLAKGDASLYLFACDAAYRLLMDASKTAKPPLSEELFNRAFMEPYADIFSEKPATTKEEQKVAAIKRGLKEQLFARWSEVFKNTPAKDLPPAVAAGKVMVDISALFAEGGLWQTLSKQVAEKQTPDAAKVAELAGQMRKVEANLLAFTGKNIKSRAVRAKMLDQLAFLRLYGVQAGVCLVNDPKNTAIPPEAQTLHACAMGWLALADELSTESQAPDAIGYACGLLRDLKNHGLYAADYAAACKVLFKKFPNNPAAATEAIAYSGILANQDRIGEGIAILEQMPKAEMVYFSAQQKALSLREQQWQKFSGKVEEAMAANKPSAEWDAKAAAALDQIIATATALEGEARKAFSADGAPGYRHASAQTARASAVVALARAQAAKGNPQQALVTLDGFEAKFAPSTVSEKDFEGHPADFAALQKGLAAQVEWAQVCRLRMLMDAGQTDQVRARAEQLLTGAGSDPDKQAKSRNVLFRLNYSLKHEVDRLKELIPSIQFEPLKLAKQQLLRRYGQAMLELTQLLKDKTITAASSQQDKDNMNLMLVKAMAASGDAKGALVLMEKLVDEEAARVKAETEEVDKYNAQHPNAKKVAPNRSLNMLLGKASAEYEVGLSLEGRAARIALVKASKSAQTIIDAFRREPRPEDGYAPEYYEAYWIRLNGSAVRAKTKGASEKTKEQAKGIPLVIQRLVEEDPKGFENSPLADFFRTLSVRLTAGQ